MVDVPFAESAAINKDTPALISGEDMVVAFNCDLKSWPITTARCGSQRMILAPISINLSTKNKRLSNIFWCIKTLPLAWVATTKIILSKSGEIGRATSELQSRENLVCRLLLEKKK